MESNNICLRKQHNKFVNYLKKMAFVLVNLFPFWFSYFAFLWDSVSLSTFQLFTNVVV